MASNPTGKQTIHSEIIAAFVSAIAGSGIGWLVWATTSNIGVAIGIAGPIAALTNVAFRKVFQ